MGDAVSEEAEGAPQTVSEIAELYLGNILYALERCAMALDADGDREGAAYYRGLAKTMADARGVPRPTK